MKARLVLTRGVLVILGASCAQGTTTIVGGGGDGGASTSTTGADGGSDAPPDGPIACLHAADCTAVADACNKGSCVDNLCVKVPANEGGSCDDGVYCTDNDVCAMGVCGGTPKTCPGVDDCHVGACDEGTKTCQPMPGNDGAFCTPKDMCFSEGVCETGVCIGTSSMDCSFLDDACNMGSCDSVMGCVQTKLPDSTACDDGNPFSECSSGACMAGLCTTQPMNEGGACDDGLFCTINDHCQAGTCVGGGPNTCAPATGCFVAFCDEAQQKCSAMPGNDGAPCTDTDVCHTGKTCMAGACVGGTPANDGMACVSSASCVVNTTCSNGVCGGGTGPTVYFADDFHDSSKGWKLDSEWQIGPAMASSCGSFGGDPATDHSPSADNGVAGVVIGGCESPTIHAPYYLTSPAFDTSGATGSVILGFYRWLNSDYDPFMHNTVDVYNGTAWVNLWKTAGPPGVNDTAWTYQSFDITAYKSAQTQIRFGYDITSGGVFTVGSWNVDDVLVASAACP